MRVVVNSPKSLSLSVLKTKFLPHCRGNLWNRLLCQANLYWQPPAGTHAPARTMPACGLKSSMMSWVFPSLFSNLDWLASTHSLPTPQGHLRCRQRRRDRSERSPIRGMNSRGEWKEEAGLISSCQKKSWKPCFFFLSFFLLLIFFFILGSFLWDSVINFFLQSKVGLQLGKTQQFVDLGARATQETLHMEIMVGDFEDRYIYRFDVWKKIVELSPNVIFSV